MTRFPVNSVIFDEAELKGEKVLFTELRADRTTVPSGLYIFELRHGDTDDSRPYEACDRVLVNFFGTVLAKRDILAERKDRSLPLGYDDFFYLDRCLTADEWIFGDEAEG